MSDAPDSTRGVADRGISRTSARERNVPRGEVHAIVPDRTYNIVGFDIGSADLSKPGIKEQLEPVIQQIQARVAQSRHPIVRITGHASESRLPGKGPEHYAAERSRAVADYLVSRGIPRAWIVTDTSRADPSRGASGRDASPEAKAWARSATLEIGSSEERRDVADRFGDITYFKQKPRFQLPEVHPPALGPILKRAGKGVLHGGEEALKATGHGIAAGGRALLAGGLVLVGAGGVLVDAGAFVVESLELTVTEVIKIAEDATGRKLGPAAEKLVLKTVGDRVVQHHLLVQQLMDWFVEAGINPHHYTQFLSESVHNWLHKTGWNVVLKTFFELHLTQTGKLPSAEQIASFVWKMMEEWGLTELPVEEYRFQDVPIKRKR